MEPIYILKHMVELSRRLALQGQVVCNNTHHDRVAVIVEPRRHPMLETVIRTFMYYLGDNWNLRIVTSQENVPWIVETLTGWCIDITPLSKSNLSTDEYSLLLMSEAFWQIMPERHVLVFQTDCVLFRKGMDNWIKEGYDYVGANYYNPAHVAPHIGGIQGGLSLRNREAMLDCIHRVPIEQVHAFRCLHGLAPLPTVIPEDIYFTHACEMLQKRVPTIDKRREFSIEADYHPYALGHHGLKFHYLTEDQQKELLADA